MGACKPVPVLSKDLLEDIPVPSGCCNHEGTPSWGVRIFAVQRFYHSSPASSTPHQPSPGRHQPPPSALHDGVFRDRENEFSYTIKSKRHRSRASFRLPLVAA